MKIVKSGKKRGGLNILERYALLRLLEAVFDEVEGTLEDDASEEEINQTIEKELIYRLTSITPSSNAYNFSDKLLRVFKSAVKELGTEPYLSLKVVFWRHESEFEKAFEEYLRDKNEN